MAEEHFVKGFEGFLEFIKDFKSDGKMVNVLFSGEKDEKVNLVRHLIKFNLSNMNHRRRFLGALIASKPNRLSKKPWTSMVKTQFWFM